MNKERVLTDEARSRRGCGWFFIIASGALVVAVLGGMLALRSVGIGSIVFLLVLLGVVALGVRLAFKPSDYIDVDLDARTFVHVREHERRGERPLDSIGTLVVSQRTRTVRTKNGTRTVTEYAVHPEGRTDLDFRVVSKPGAARVSLESLARRWQLPSVAWGGDVRQPDQLDIPLHERLRSSEEHRRPMELRPEWNLRVETLSPGYAIVSSHRAWNSLTGAAIGLVVLVIAGVTMARNGIFTSILEAAEASLPDMVFGSLFVIAMLAFAVWSLLQLRDVFLPGTIRITPEGVSYRGRRMRFAEIEEVISELSIAFVGDRRLLTVPPTFCPLEALPTLRHELERMIVELGGREPS